MLWVSYYILCYFPSEQQKTTFRTFRTVYILHNRCFGPQPYFDSDQQYKNKNGASGKHETALPTLKPLLKTHTSNLF